jgi:hypothetical protein
LLSEIGIKYRKPVYFWSDYRHQNFQISITIIIV